MINSVSWILDQCEVSQIDIAVAYITTQGIEKLISTFSVGLGNRWPDVKKRWLTSFDYLRTTPLALSTINDLPMSKLRIHNSAVLDRSGCVPGIPFHPKSMIFTGSDARFVLAGSGNISKSGLTRGHEAGIVVGVPDPVPENAAQSAACIDTFETWFDGLWGPATKLNPALLSRYRDIYESQPNLKNPTPTEDDTTPEHTKRGQLTPVDLRKLRVCANLWIEADRHITRNRGAGLPGNQLMMKRLTRVFFGFAPDDVPRDSQLGHLKIVYGNHNPHDCSLTFSNNLMDKLTLPVPGVDGPAKYDNENLLFQRVGPSMFRLTVGSNSAKAQWRRRSQEIDAAFKMGGGRAWGVF
ncbi:hypothetical protein [Sphingomonas sp. BAUL-RG-20F-R05-02]|uniref:hypothetical protein n=1 Tax=Sphingomonas sp. BAUL-RG-20F-R05-02 TaxID=2914830 RepID=UPI001F57F3CC|nr:hypothetical protein [Sphingomonas sp. BAUL-RG-20F-R05-02]